MVKFLLAVLNVECPLQSMVGVELAHQYSAYFQTRASDAGGGADEQAEG